MKRILYTLIALALVFAIGLAPLTMAAEETDPCEPLMVVDLIAGQDMVVGTVTVENDSENLCITYALNEEVLADGWLIYETHLFVSATDEFAMTRANKKLGQPYYSNPVPGLYPYGDEFEEGVPEWTFCISLEELGVEFGDEVYVSAHAVILTETSETLAVAPYGGSQVVDTLQAWRIDHTPEAPRYVRGARSNPDNALELGIPGQETFYSLGYGGVLNGERTAVEAFFGQYFEDRRDPVDIREMEAWVDEDLAAMLSDTENNAGWIIIEFDPAALSVEGEPDIQVVEDTWGLPYPLELAAVFGRADAEDDWTFLFLAHNQQPVGSPTYHTYTLGELGDLGQAVQILVQDVSNPQWFIPYPHSVATLDGYDLNAVLALHDHIVTEGFGETAWGDGDRFNEQGNWGMWFMYHVCDPEPCVPHVYGILSASASGNLAGSLYRIDVANQTYTLLYENLDTYRHPYGNALALDEDSGRLYFTLSDSGSVAKELWFYDFAEGVIVNAEAPVGFALGRNVCGAAFWDGYYWYIPDHSTSLMRMSFHVDGTVDEVTEVATLSPSPGGFGDVVYRDGIFYGSSTSRYFTYDISAEEYTILFTGDHTNNAQGVGLQLAWGTDGVLYGHSYVHRTWWDVDPATGQGTYLFTSDISFGDLAGGSCGW